MSLVVDQRSLQEINKEINRIGRELANAGLDIRDDIEKSLHDSGQRIRNTIINAMRTTPKTGRRYKVGKSATHIASRPFFPPAINTGRLVGSIIFSTGPLRLEVGSAGVKYGKFLEDGTKNMKSRPWLRPSVDTNRNNIIFGIQKAARKNLEAAFERRRGRRR